jgi:hypothetical protein
MIKWFVANKLVLNLDKTNIVEIYNKYYTTFAFCIGYKENYTEETVNTKFLVYHLNWKHHTEQMIPKLSGAY